MGLFGEPERAIGVSRLDGFKESFGNETMLLLYGDKDIAVHYSHTPVSYTHLGNDTDFKKQTGIHWERFQRH